jgi:predicted permease
MSGAPKRTPLALRIAANLLPHDAREEVLGDLVEAWSERERTNGRRSAWFWALRQPLVSIGARLAFRTRLPRALHPGSGIGFSWIDVKLGVRILRKQPILTVVAGLTLALGIPAALIPTHIMSALDTDLPVDEGDRVLGLRNWDLQANDPASASLLHDFTVWRETLASFEELGAARSDPWNVHSPDGRAAEVRGAQVTASVFSILRVPPLLGRTLLSSDEVEGAPDVVVIAEDLWESRFARDPEIVGATIAIGRRPHTIVGVMPEGFAFPIRDYLWLPLRADPADYALGGGPDLLVLGRLADGISTADASAELATVGARLRAEWPATHETLRPEVLSFSLVLMNEPATGLAASWEIILLQLFCFAVLAIACGNVGTLILARTATRLNEISVRTALGAGRARILSQLFAESLVLALGATAAGLVLAQTVVVGFAESLIDDDLPYWLDLDLTPRMILIALGLGAGSAVIAGVLPAIKATNARIQQNLQAATRGASVRFGALTTALIVVEVAVSVCFLCFGTALAVTFMEDRSGDAGVEIDRYLIAGVRTPWVDPTTADSAMYAAAFQARTAANQDELLARLAADGAVRHVAMGANIPGRGHGTRWVTVEGADSASAVPVLGARVHIDYFRGLDIDVLQGRAFTSADVDVPDRYLRRAVVVNDQFVRDVFGGGSAVGRLIRFTDLAPDEPSVPYEIVGVVETFGTNFQNPDRSAAVYHPLSSADVHPMSYVIEVGGDATAFIPTLRSIVSTVDPEAIVERPRSLTELVAEQQLESRTVTWFVLILSAVGMILAATGLYALMSFTVSQRTREIGIRTALGADAKNVIATIARRAFAQLVVGVAIGSALGALLLNGNSDEFFAVNNMPLLVSGVAVAVVAFSALSCLAPIRRGLRIQPTEALREA